MWIDNEAHTAVPPSRPEAFWRLHVRDRRQPQRPRPRSRLRTARAALSSAEGDGLCAAYRYWCSWAARTAALTSVGSTTTEISMAKLRKASAAQDRAVVKWRAASGTHKHNTSRGAASRVAAT